MACCGCWAAIWKGGGLAGVLMYAPGPGRWGVAGGAFIWGGWGARRSGPGGEGMGGGWVTRWGS